MTEIEITSFVFFYFKHSFGQKHLYLHARFFVAIVRTWCFSNTGSTSFHALILINFVPNTALTARTITAVETKY